MPQPNCHNNSPQQYHHQVWTSISLRSLQASQLHCTRRHLQCHVSNTQRSHLQRKKCTVNPRWTTPAKNPSLILLLCSTRVLYAPWICFGNQLPCLTMKDAVQCCNAASSEEGARLRLDTIVPSQPKVGDNNSVETPFLRLLKRFRKHNTKRSQFVKNKPP